MGNKRSEKKRDAARRAAEEAADKMDSDPNPPIGTAQEKQESACGEAEHQLHYDEILVMLFQSDACTCTCKQSLSCLPGTFPSRSLTLSHLAQQVSCMYCLGICNYGV